jgi:CheY-like chemotaxis protein
MAGKAILLVEDNEVQREGITVVLSRAGYLVIPVADGQETLALLNSGVTPDLILMDMMMPPPDGWHIMAMRQKTPALASVPVAIMTSLGVASEEWAADLGACALIRKPVEVEPLLAEIRRCLGEGQE